MKIGILSCSKVPPSARIHMLCCIFHTLYLVPQIRRKPAVTQIMEYLLLRRILWFG